MNQGRVWCVVNPTIGLPAFLGSVALISFTVHFAVIENTTWVKRFFNGSDAAAAAAAAPKTAAANGYTIRVAPTGPDGAVKVDVTPAGAGQQAMNAVLQTPAKSPAPAGG